MTSVKPNRKSSTGMSSGNRHPLNSSASVRHDGRRELGEPPVDEDLEADHDDHRHPVRPEAEDPRAQPGQLGAHHAARGGDGHHRVLPHGRGFVLRGDLAATQAVPDGLEGEQPHSGTTTASTSSLTGTENGRSHPVTYRGLYCQLSLATAIASEARKRRTVGSRAPSRPSGTPVDAGPEDELEGERDQEAGSHQQEKLETRHQPGVEPSGQGPASVRPRGDADEMLLETINRPADLRGLDRTS